jgi:hypothetical protein
MKTHLEELMYNSIILHIGTRWRSVVSSMLRPLYTPREKAPSTHWIGGWVGPGVYLDAMVYRKISYSCRESNPQPLRLSLLLY